MNLQEAFERYSKENSKNARLRTYRKGIEDYIEMLGGCNLNCMVALEKEHLSKYVYRHDGRSLTNKYFAVNSFYMFIKREILGLPSIETVFPLDKKEVEIEHQKRLLKGEKLNKQNKRTEVLFLQQNFNFGLLFE